MNILSIPYTLFREMLRFSLDGEGTLVACRVGVNLVGDHQELILRELARLEPSESWPEGSQVLIARLQAQDPDLRRLWGYLPAATAWPRAVVGLWPSPEGFSFRGRPGRWNASTR